MTSLYEQLFAQSSAQTEDPLIRNRRKTLHFLLWLLISVSFVFMIVVVITRYTTPQLLNEKDETVLIRASAFGILGFLGIALLDRYLSYEIAGILLNLVLIGGIALGDTPNALVTGRSVVFLILPIITSSVLLRPWAGLVVAALECSFIFIVPTILQTGLPNIPGLFIILLIALIIQRSISSLENTLKREYGLTRSLQESQDRFRKVTESLSNAILVTDLDSNITECNKAAYRMLGFSSKDELIGKNGFSIITPDEMDHAKNISTHLHQGGSVIETEFKNLRKDGSIFISDLSATTITDWNGKTSSYVFMLQDITERKKGEETLRASEEKFSRIFQISPEPMAITGPDGKFQDVNQSFQKTFGYQFEEIIGHTSVELGMIVDQVQNEKSFQIFSEQGKLNNFEMSTRTRSGEIIYGIFFAEKLELNGQMFVLSLMVNISTRKQMEDTLQASEAQYHNLIDNLPIGVIVHQGGKLKLINPAGLKILGLDNSENCIGRSILDFIHPDYRESVQKRVRDSLKENNKAVALDEKLVKLDGTTIDAEVLALPVKFKEEPAILAIFNDITSRKQVERALMASEENFRNLSENTVDGILIVAPNGRHLYANRKACDLFLYSSEELLTTSLNDLVDPSVYPFIHQRMKERFDGLLVPATYESIARRKDSASFPVEITATRTTWQSQFCILVIIHDITERKRAQDATRKQNERIQDVSRQLINVQENEKRLLAYELHDDFGQSLTSLKLMLDLVSRAPTGNDQLQTIKDAHDLISELMNKVRNLSLDLRPAMLDDFGLFAALRWFFDRFQTQTGITIQSNLDLNENQRFSAPVEIAVFRIIQEALTNIARHAAISEAQVSVKVNETFTIEIADKGIGFDNSPGSGKARHSSGISGMEERIRLVGGQLQVHSQKGAGTRIVVEIPLMEGFA